MKKKIALTIAGLDGSSGAGILADTKTFLAHNLYALNVVTSIAIQNTTGVKDKFDIDKGILDRQLKVLFEDININVIKIGMIPNKKSIKIIAKYIKNYNIKIVLDPVIASSSGYELLNKKGIKTLKTKLIPITDIITPNIKEAEILTNYKINSVKKMKKAAKKLYNMGTKAVLLKGGHLSGKNAIDILYDGKKFYCFKNKKIKSNTNFHGTGCMLASSIAANIANGLDMIISVQKAKDFVTKQIKHSFKISPKGAKYII